MVKLAEVCADDLIAFHIIQFSPSVGVKLLRAKVISQSFTVERICTLVAASSKAPKELDDKISTKEWLLTLQSDCADELLASGLLFKSDLTSLLCITAARNFMVASALLIERGANVHHIEVRRCRRRGLVDIAAHAAGLDDDWRLVLLLLTQGAAPVSPQGVLFTPLRQGKIELVRKLLNTNLKCDYECLSSLLCDMCSHGQLQSIALLLGECGVPVNVLNPRDGLTGTDRALAWHRWETAEWLISKQQGMPSQKEMALGNLMDASYEPRVLRLIDLLLFKKFFDMHDILRSVVQRGDFALCQHLLARENIQEDTSLFPVVYPIALVDEALCHGHLRIGRTLLIHGVKPRNPARCRADAALHGGSFHQVVAEILKLLPAASGAQIDGATSQHHVNCAAEHMASDFDSSVLTAGGLAHEADGLALVPLCSM